ncbi:hypothetical protein UA08_06245 [Talaromyces atroroseus]|uniref:Tail specific protease domain-containing protein n=1 Tax=Talaromyces atroroseus TaxID=1441469 RepID=A0A225AWE1_TALAT|nr:hypothetical protein UA08_06245 [Talaromyces atroroseus]OKL58755.1 hypothetical protein UA08_06245 [Talaromyces atroroseus]
MADATGNTLTRLWSDTSSGLYHDYHLVASEWVVTDRINAAPGQRFFSWDEFFDPNSSYGSDNFSQIGRYNLSNVVFDKEASGGIVVDGHASGTGNGSSPSAAQDIIILRNGLCSSSCAVFVEMMHHEAGVRNVAVGGRPSYGLMQGPGRSRGAALYSTSQLDTDIWNARHHSKRAARHLPHRRKSLFVTSASFNLRNLRDQVRRDNTTMSLQFLYEPADCRIFFTPSTWYNYTNLWKYAADAIWNNTGLCVKNSTSQDGLEPDRLVYTGDATEIITDSFQQGFPPIIREEEMFGGRHDLSMIQNMECTTNRDCAAPGHFSFRMVTTCHDENERMVKSLCVAECSSSKNCAGAAFVASHATHPTHTTKKW